MSTLFGVSQTSGAGSKDRNIDLLCLILGPEKEVWLEGSRTFHRPSREDSKSETQRTPHPRKKNQNWHLIVTSPVTKDPSSERGRKEETKRVTLLVPVVHFLSSFWEGFPSFPSALGCPVGPEI